VINNVGSIASVPAFAVSSPKIKSSLRMSASDSALKMVSLLIVMVTRIKSETKQLRLTKIYLIQPTEFGSC
jgi:hypothetical protein